MTEAGLCASCSFARRIRSHRGSAFVLCERSRSDRRFVRYPRLPMVQCVGYVGERAAGGAEAAPPERAGRSHVEEGT